MEKFVTHRIYLGKVVDLSTGTTIDKVLVSFFKAPNSYTGEDIIEISCHGGPAILQNILNQLVKAGARIAEPGEFTKRAFLNGKIDLAQAEAVVQLIDAKSESAARIAEEQLEGKLSKEIKNITSEVKKITAFVEATIDFPEEDEEFISDANIQNKLKKTKDIISQLIKSYDQGRIIRSGVKTVIAGPPNAGKSSLLNALLGVERAIVHHIPGTTRDTIEEEIIIEDVPFRFIDTAGIRDAEEEVEEIGVDKSRKEASTAEVVLLVLDGSDHLLPDDKFIKELEAVEHVIIVINKSDLKSRIQLREIKKIFKDRPIFKISATNGKGVDKLSKGLTKEMLGKRGFEENEGIIIASRRHFNLLNQTLENLDKAISSVKDTASVEFIAIDLRAALNSLGEIIGEITTDDLLDEIFSNFCIGK